MWMFYWIKRRPSVIYLGCMLSDQTHSWAVYNYLLKQNSNRSKNKNRLLKHDDLSVMKVSHVFPCYTTHSSFIPPSSRWLHIFPLLFCPYLFVLVSVTPFQSLWLAARPVGHVVHWLGRSGIALCLLSVCCSHTIYSMNRDTQDPRACVRMNTDTHRNAHTITEI